jgi:hypothetical protein
VSVVGTHDMRGREMIMAFGSRGHMASDWNFVDMRTGKFKGRNAGTREVGGRDMITVV